MKITQETIRQRALVKANPNKEKTAKISTVWLHGGYRCLPIKESQLCGVVINFGGYSGEIAQIDDEIKEKLIFRIRPFSTISLLVSRSDISDMRCFPIDGMKKQSFDTTERILILSLAYRQQLTLFFPPLFDFKKIELSSSPCPSQSSKLF